MSDDIRGKTALVTGAAKRIGKEIAIALASFGVNVVVHYNSSVAEAEAVKLEAKAKGVKAWLLRADFAAGEYQGLLERAFSEAGKIDYIVNSASIFPKSTLKEMTLEGLTKNIQVNAWAPFVLARDLSRLSGRGRIVNLIDSRVSDFDLTHAEYILSKHVLLELTRMMAVEFAPDITVNGVSPGLILPPPGGKESFLKRMEGTVPMKRHGAPADIAEAVVYLLRAGFVTGEVINVDGGRHLKEYDKGQDPH